MIETNKIFSTPDARSYAFGEVLQTVECIVKNIEKIRKEFGYLRGLKELDLSYNQIKEIPKELMSIVPEFTYNKILSPYFTSTHDLKPP